MSAEKPNKPSGSLMSTALTTASLPFSDRKLFLLGLAVIDRRPRRYFSRRFSPGWLLVLILRNSEQRRPLFRFVYATIALPTFLWKEKYVSPRPELHEFGDYTARSSTPNDSLKDAFPLVQTL